MKNLLILLVAMLGWSVSRADIKFVNFNKIDPSGRYAGRFSQLVEHLPYYDHFSPDWIYEIPKDTLVQELTAGLRLFGTLKGDELETDLLLGELAHYLYNLDQKTYYDTAELYLTKAIGLDGKDPRGYWFLAYHYALSNEVVKGVQTFEQARSLVSDATPGEVLAGICVCHDAGQYAIALPVCAGSVQT